MRIDDPTARAARAARARRAAAALCFLALIGGCAADRGGKEASDGRAASPAPPPPSATAGMGPRDGRSTPTAPPESIFVFNTHGNEQGEAEQRPADLVATASTTFTGLEWRTWGGGPAAADGHVQGTWCLPDCRETPYPATVELSGAEIVDGTAFYTRYSFDSRADVPEEMRDRMREAADGRLTLPSAW